MSSFEERYAEILKKKKEYAKLGVDIPVEECQIILNEEQRALAEIYLKECGNRTYEKMIARNLGIPQISDTLDSGLDHDTNTVVLKNMDGMVSEVIRNATKKTNGITDKDAVIDDGTYIEYMINSDGVALDHYLTVFPHELRHLFGDAGTNDFTGFGMLAEGKTELDTQEICAKYDVPYFMKRNYAEEVDYVRKLQEIVGKDVVDEAVSFKSREFSRIIDSLDEGKKQAAFDYLQSREGNSIKKEVSLRMGDFSKSKDELKAISDYLEEHPDVMWDSNMLESDPKIQEQINGNTDLFNAIKKVVEQKRSKMQIAKENLGDEFERVVTEYKGIEDKRLDFLNKNIVQRLNPEQLQEFTDRIKKFNDKYCEEENSKKLNTALTKAGIMKMAKDPKVVLENENAEEAMMYKAKDDITQEEDRSQDDK